MSLPRMILRIVFLATAASFAIAEPLQAQNPLGLSPGVPATLTLNQVTTLTNFNTSIATGEISYTNSDLATRQYVVRLPLGYNATDTTKKYGLITYIDAGDAHTFPSSYAEALDAHDIIWIGGQGIGNSQSTNLRMGVAIMGAFRMTQLYNIDPSRIYVSGLSGGGRTASSLGYLRHDFFRGFIGRVGSSIPGTIPGWECAGTNSGNLDDNYEVGSGSSVVLPAAFRTALMTQTGDFRRAENLAIYRWGHLNHGNVARAIVRPGGHSDEVGDSFKDAVRFLYHPHVDVIWDRFENANLAANVQAGKTVAGSGFTAVSGNVSETAYSYNSVSHGVLRLAGDGALARANDAFAWKNNSGILLDARLRSQDATTSGQNQQIGLHIVAEGSTGNVTSRPGFHIYWCYGAPYRAEVVSVSGTRQTLATWEHAATHPMALGTTNEKTFWGDTAAPDFAGKTRSFRGEDVRLVLSGTGFQLTFNRFANNLQTTYPGVQLVSTDSSTPYAENIPMVLQGLWSSVETALVNALPSGNYQLLISNSAINSGQPVGTAFVDEIRVVGSNGQQAAPPAISVTAPSNGQRFVSWAPIHGALGYSVQRSTSPDSGFTTLAEVPNVGWTSLTATSSSAGTNPAHTDFTASNSSAYYYRVAAIGVNGTLGFWSPTGFAARTGSVPAAPTGLAVSYPADYQVRLAWTDAANNETGYRVERSPAGFAQWTLVTGSLAANTSNFTDTTVAAGVTYDYRVSAVGAAGISGFASATATVPDAAPPVPAGLAGNATFTSANLTWTAVPQAATYRVKRSTASGGPYTTIAGNLTSATHVDAGLVPGTTYHYVVSSVGAALESANSAEISLSTPAIPVPGNLTVTPGFTTNTLAWTAAPGVSTYTIRRATASGGPFSIVATNVTGTSYVDTALSAGTNYFYSVTSSVDASESDPTPAANGTPVAGTFLKANNATALDQASSWSPAAIPTLADTVSWNGTYANATVSVGTGLQAGTLRILAPSTSVSVEAGSGNLTLGTGGMDLSLATQNLAINAPVLLAANQTWTIPTGRTVVIAQPLSAISPSTTLAFTGNGTLSFNGTGSATPVPGAFVSSNGTFRVNQAAGNITFTAANFPAGSSNAFTSLTGASGSRVLIDAASSANLSFASNTAGFTIVVRNGNVTYNALSGNTDATNIRVEGGVFTVSGAAARYQIAAANQTFQLTGGTVDVSKVTSFGFRVGGSGSATQAGAQNVVATQSGGTLLASFCNVGGNDTTATRSPSYTLTGGNFSVTSTASNALQIGADTGGNGTSTFALGGGKLVVPGTISGGQTGARQVFSMTGGILAASVINFTNLRSGAGDAANGTFAVSGGTVAPGDSGIAGRTSLTGNATFGANSTIGIDVAGTTQATAFQTGQHDFLSVSGTTQLAGLLRVRLTGGFVPANSANFTILTASGGLSGSFSNVAFGARLTTEGGEGSFLVSQSGNSVVLSAYQPALTPLESWRQTHFGSSANAGPAADSFDFDGDGLSNLVEYALDTLPNSAASGTNPTSQVVSNRLQLSFLRARSDVTYIVEGSSNLAPGSWQTIATNPGTVGSNVTAIDSVELPSTSNQGRFIRLRITAP